MKYIKAFESVFDKIRNTHNIKDILVDLEDTYDIESNIFTMENQGTVGDGDDIKHVYLGYNEDDTASYKDMRNDLDIPYYWVIQFYLIYPKFVETGTYGIQIVKKIEPMLNLHMGKLYINRKICDINNEESISTMLSDEKTRYCQIMIEVFPD